MTNNSNIQPTFREHEGFYYLEFEGEFYKGCKRCGGEGHFSYNGEHSRCYTCDDTDAKLGEQFSSEAEAQKWCHGKALRRAQAERKREREVAARMAAVTAKQEALRAEAPDVLEFLLTVDTEATEDRFIRAMAANITYASEVDHPFTAKMIEAVRVNVARAAEKAAEAAAHPAPVGRVAVTGEIASSKLVENDFGYAYKILVKDDAGFRVWVSVPKALADEAEETHGFGWFTQVNGRRLTFTATLNRSDDDVSFAFGSRPTKGSWL